MAKKASGLPRHGITMVAEGTVLQGTLRAEGDVRVGGRLVGAVAGAARVVVAPGGVIEGDVTARGADVAGVIQGNLQIGEHLVLRPGARVDGDVDTGLLVVEDGAVFNGTCRMRGVDPSVLKASPVPTEAARSWTGFLSKRGEKPATRTPSPTKPSPPKAASAPPVPHTSAPRAAPVRAEPSAEAPKSVVPPRPKPSAPPAQSTGDKPTSRVDMAALGIVFAAVLVAGAYFGLGAIRPDESPRPAPPVDQPAATSEVAAADPAGSEAAVVAAEVTDDGGLPSLEPPEEAPLALPVEATRQAAALARIAMAQARQRVQARGAERAVARLFQQAEAVRQTGLQQFEDGNFEAAARAFRAAHDGYDRVQQALAEAGEPAEEAVPERAPEDPPIESPAATLETPDEAAPDIIEPPEVMAEETPDDDVGEVTTAINRLSRQLKRNIEQENVGGMQALFHRGWAPFFEEAQAITASVRTGDVQRDGTQATAAVSVDLSYQDADGQLRQQTRAFTWTLTRLSDGWVLLRVAPR